MQQDGARLAAGTRPGVRRRGKGRSRRSAAKILRMMVDEMLQDQLQLCRMGHVAMRARVLEIVANHRADADDAFMTVDEVVAQFGGGDARNVFVLGDGLDLVFVKLAQGDAVFIGEHSAMFPTVFAAPAPYQHELHKSVARYSKGSADSH
jgi:hypothetical protein